MIGRSLVLVALCSSIGLAQGASPYRPGIDVLDYLISITLPDTGASIRGDVMLTVRRTARVDTLVLDLRDLQVTRTTVDDRVRRFRRTDSTVHIPLPPGDSGTFRVQVLYGGRVTDGLIVRQDSLRRWTYFGDNWPNRARHWIPSVDHPSDKATVNWVVRGPRGRTVVANGTLIETRTTGTGRAARVVTRWQQAQPIPTYLMVIAAAPLARHDLGETACGLSDHRRCVRQSVYVAPEQRPVLPGNFAKAGDMVAFFASRVGSYPYEKLAHLQSTTRFGGMENASAIFYSDAAFRGGGVREGLIAHETAHQWFGNAVTQREWPHLWLSEGFATYFAALWTQHAHGDTAFLDEMARIRTVILDDTVAVPRRPVIDTTQTNLVALLNRNSYQKGGWVLHMLRSELGDTVFFSALRDYYRMHKHGNALTPDLRARLEVGAGRPLDRFFDQWLRRPGYPEVVVAWETDSTSRSIQITITQGARFGTFEFPLQLALTDSSGLTRHVEFAVPAQLETRLVLPISGGVARVDVDPDVRLLARITVRKQ
ncbi:MAG: M1 family metallopeptidase [Gemmatimonadaceae bacterium]